MVLKCHSTFRIRNVHCPNCPRSQPKCSNKDNQQINNPVIRVKFLLWFNFLSSYNLVIFASSLSITENGLTFKLVSTYFFLKNMVIYYLARVYIFRYNHISLFCFTSLNHFVKLLSLFGIGTYPYLFYINT